MSKNVARRDLVKGACLAAAGLGASTAGTSLASETADRQVWDEEADVVVVGSGTGLFAAFISGFNGATSIVLEKADIVGGTTVTSGGWWWIPANRWMGADGLGSDWTEDEAIEYLEVADISHGSSSETKEDYVRNFHRIAEYIEDTMGYPLMVGHAYGEYDKVPGAKGEGHSIVFKNVQSGERMRASEYIPDLLVPAIESSGGKIITGTKVTELVRDDSGKVCGVVAQAESGTIRVRANQGVVLAAGGFDHNEAMRNAYLRGPIYGTMTSSGCTGDGIVLGQLAGAGLGNMQNTLGGNVFLDEYVPGDYSFDHNMGFDFGSYRANYGTIIVNKHGHRFMDESVPYSNYPDAAYNYDTSDHSWTNIPGYLIFSQEHVDLYGWPGSAEERPEWVGKFDSLDDLASVYGIAAENLKSEIERFNGFCDTGDDLDFTRGTNPWSQTMVPADVETAANKCLGRIEPPYYVALIAPASLGTKGGLTVDVDSRVLDAAGNPIEGLYAAGTNAAGPLGWTYGGGGGGVGPGLFHSFKAVNHMLDLGLLG